MKHAHHHHRERRARLIADMRSQSGGGLAAIPTAPQAIRNADTHYPYRPDSHFYYLSGFPEAEAVIVLFAGAEAGDSRQVLFCRDKNPEREIWDGFRYGPDAAREIFGFDEAYSISELAARLAEWTCDRPALYTPLGLYAEWDHAMTATLNEVRGRVRTGVAAPEAVIDVRALIGAMRLVKDADELALMRRAAEISSAAHRRAMARTRAGWYEYQVEAELTHEFLRSGAQAVAYPSIVASGPNACVLHYRDNNRQMQPSDLLLIDAGCEFEGYASDITRTFPVGGRFAGAQKAVYELVLAAQLACLEALAPGKPFHDYHRTAERVLAAGLVDLKLCAGPVDAVLESGAYKQFYMHRAGHWLGLDVHDVGLYRVGGESRPLEPGMVLTVEPGCYIRPAENVPEEFWDIGVRIEDDVLITERGIENLTGGTPKTVADVEAACSR
ncbi:MAG: aminopeptidase P N-terminal domain-containing protein [Acidobacteriota bacterium]|jgi:Xaa-Pro aminopeptidase|nr:aminopeptidase P N-terminal domain-containing protein [Casimicrobiaceae bacterium]